MKNYEFTVSEPLSLGRCTIEKKNNNKHNVAVRAKRHEKKKITKTEIRS